MKFTYGAWQTPAGVVSTLMRRLYRSQVDNERLSVVGLDRSGAGGDRFEGTVFQIDVTSPLPNVIRVRAQHHAPARAGVQGFDLNYDLRAEGVKIDEQADHLLFTSGDLSLRFDKNGWNTSFEHAGERVTGGGSGSLGYVKVDGVPRMMQRLSLGVGECIYGLGERFGPLVKNGQTVVVWNEDGGTVSELAYKNVPFYLSSRGYGLLVNSPGKVELEIATERVSQIQFSTPGEVLDYYVFFGPDPKRVLDLYTQLCGRPAQAPAWSFGLWLSTSFTTQYDEKTVMEFVDGMATRRIPLGVFHFDCFWMKERHWCDFEWDHDAFPDPRGMLTRLKAKGLKICVWINSYIAQLSPLFAEGRDNGYLLKRRDGSVFQIDQWQPGMALVDFTNPAAVTWFQGKLRGLLEMGVDCFKTDFGERIPLDVAYHDGSDPALMHNYYAYLYNKTVFELLEDFHGRGKAIVFARSATAGSQKFPLHWGGDCEATWESMAEDLRGGLSFCMSGNAFWSHDIGGFAGKADAALYKRWIAFGLLSSHSRLHGSESYRVPWLFDEESVDVMRHFTHLKNRLFPYLYAAAHDAHTHGWPVMRAMMLEFPDDPNCLHLDRQYMLGGALLVAPVFRADGVADYYLPAGVWTDMQTGATVAGNQWRRERVDFMRVPLFARANTVVPMSLNEAGPQWRSAEPLAVHVFHLNDGADVAVTVRASDDDQASTFRARRRGQTITLESDRHATNVRLILRTETKVTRAENGQILSQEANVSVIQWAQTKRMLTLGL